MKTYLIILVLVTNFQTSAQEEIEYFDSSNEQLEVVEFEEISENEIPDNEYVETVNISEEEDYLAPFEKGPTTEPVKSEPVQSAPLLNQSSYQEVSFIENTRKNLLFRDKFKVGFDTARWDYEEFVNGQTFMKDGGQLYGVKAIIEQTISDSDAFWNLSARFLTGDTLYEGGNTAGERFNLESQNSITEFATHLGYAFELSDYVFFRPSFGLSYRQLSNPATNFPGTYSREAKYFTVPLNAELAIVATDRFILSLGTNYHYLIQANTESKLSEATTLFDDINSEQNIGQGYGASISFSWLTNNNTITFSPYYRVWDFEDSESVLQTVTEGLTAVTYGFREPKNKTQEIGASLTIGF